MANQIKRYGLIVEDSPEVLVTSVTKELKVGWLPLGGISVARENASPGVKARTVYAQAMFLPYTAHDAMGEVIARVNGG
jgi:hypothetical protein